MNIRITSGPYEQSRQDIVRVREEVFIIEQKVPKNLELDDRDVFCVHAVAWLDGKAIGTGRLDPKGKIGRVAVLQAYRGHGIGKEIMAELEAVARSKKMKRVYLHAQESVISFYENLGYTAYDEMFVEAGIVHQKMEKYL
jgi:predicted GNAT family N-acyltransferase